MAFAINPSIALGIQERDFGRGFDRMQDYQAKRLELDRLREQFNQEKEARLRQKQMQQGIASELQKMQQGTPAQYNTTFPQTMPTGQMPQGMTGVLAAERGQNMPTPDLFGENILKGNFDVRREMIAPEVKGVTPDYMDILQVAAKHALYQNDVDSYVKFANAIKQERAANDIEWSINPTKGINPQTGLPDAYITNRKGDVKWLGSGVYEAPKDPKTSLIITSQGYEVVKEGELPKGAPVVAAKDDPVERAGAVADAKAEAKVRQDLIADAANVVKTYNLMNPMIISAIDIVKKLPPDMLQSKYQSMLAGTPLNKYLGNTEQQKAITDYNLMLENLRLYIEKPAGSISNYEQGILGRAIGILEGNYSNEQKESALKQVKAILDNQKNVAENVLKQNKAERFNYNSQKDKPLRFTKQANSAQRKEYGDAIFAAKGDPEKIREIQEYARELGVLE